MNSSANTQARTNRIFRVQLVRHLNIQAGLKIFRQGFSSKYLSIRQPIGQTRPRKKYKTIRVTNSSDEESVYEIYIVLAEINIYLIDIKAIYHS